MFVAAYFSKLKGLWDELSSYNDLPICTCGASKNGEEREQIRKVMQFLMGLNDSYAAVRGQILLIQPLPSVGKIYSMILQEEKQRDLVISREVLMTDTQKTNANSNSSNRGKGKFHCSHCNGNNHTIDRCFHLHGFPPNHKSHKNGEKTGNKIEPIANNTQLKTPSFTNKQYQQLLALLNDGNAHPKANIAGQLVPLCLSSHTRNTYSNKRVIDSGATNHITSSLDSLHKVSSSLYISISLPNENKVQIDSIGLIKFGFDFLIKEIFHVPSFCDNLLFVIKMTKSLNCSVIFFPDSYILQDLATKKTIGLGKQHNGLYYFSTNTTPLISLSTQKVNQAST